MRAAHIRGTAIRERHPLAGKTVVIHPRGKPIQGVMEGAIYEIEDWWINVNGTPWGESQGNPAAMVYGIRAGFADLPPDDEVLYGKIDHLGYLVHVSELGEVVS